MGIVQGQGEQKGNIVLYGWLGTILLLIYAPILLVMLFSFNSGRFQGFPFQGLTLAWYQAMFADTAFVESLQYSLWLSVAVSIVATSLGFLGAYALVKSTFVGKTALTGFLITPIAAPSILLAVALRVYFFRLGWQFSLLTAFLGHLVFALPLAVFVLRSRLLQIPLNLEEAAWILGARRWRSLLEVVLPLCFPGIVASLLLTFTFSFDEFIMSYFLTQFEVTLPIKIWTNLITGFDPTVNAISSIVFVLSMLVTLISQRLLASQTSNS
ncbi:ABC transporter permease [Oscillatoria sp. FACHB-1407]|uniref:ABC transporter permease n=1 Tax=Oscillatoria sp. FACHB-1407 TaxID=2692847 RepID=UPI0016893D26|nr:ABC transporter permease [Oscillatoria sp. FACHB-1407]MBD2459725.1 ABC transporter permease [Oscillatoria sp. FACHB-1407]